MYLARVLVGEYAQGKQGMLTPPPKDPNNPTNTYDTVVNNGPCPTVFVVFYDWQCYPEYLITFQGTWSELNLEIRVKRQKKETKVKCGNGGGGGGGDAVHRKIFHHFRSKHLFILEMQSPFCILSPSLTRVANKCADLFMHWLFTVLSLASTSTFLQQKNLIPGLVQFGS